jgi:tetratricopeptide (TPR) repeat protein
MEEFHEERGYKRGVKKDRIYEEETEMTMVLKKIRLTVFLFQAFLFSILAVAAAEGGTDLKAAMSEMAGSSGYADAMKVCDRLISGCKTYDDYENLVSDLKAEADKKKSGFKYNDLLQYAVGKARLAELKDLASKNDIESGRLYMSVNDKYYNEALDYLNRAASSTGSQMLRLNSYAESYSALKERFQTEKAEAVFNEILASLLSYLGTMQERLDALSMISDRLKAMGFPKEAIRLKTEYAKRAGPEAAGEIAKGLKAEADKYFEEKNTRDAAALYDSYLELARDSVDKETVSSSVMEMAEKYFNAGRYREARKYYELYAETYPDMKLADYANYRIASCLDNEKNYTMAIPRYENFLEKYQHSVWFDRAFEDISRLYYSNLSYDDALAGLKDTIDKYYRKPTGDYAQLLKGLLYYGKKDYVNARKTLSKIEETSMYNYAAGTIIKDIDKIEKEGCLPSFSSGSEDTYKMFEPYTPTKVEIKPSGVKEEDISYSEGAVMNIKTAPGTVINFTADAKDLDRFGEYKVDRTDQSRLPKLVNELTEQDLIIIKWSCESGTFTDDKETPEKGWKAPDAPGRYKIKFGVTDLGVTRVPDKGTRKDPAKDTEIIINVQ